MRTKCSSRTVATTGTRSSRAFWERRRPRRRGSAPSSIAEYFWSPMTPPDILEKLVSLCKRRGFVFQSSEIYGGLGSVWDYGPLGIELKNNIKRAWWRSVVYEREDKVGLDAGILMNRLAWKYSGHEA